MFPCVKDERFLSSTWTGDDELISVISSALTNNPTLFNEPEVHNRTPPECQRNLESDNRYNTEKSVILTDKNNRRLTVAASQQSILGSSI